MILKGAKKVTATTNFNKKPLTNREKLERLAEKNNMVNVLIEKLSLDSDLPI